MKKTKLGKWLSVGLITLICSCSKNDLDIVRVFDNTDLTVSTAHAWFDQNSGQKTIDKLKNKRFVGIIPIWNQAELGTQSSGEKFVEVPLKLPDNASVENGFLVNNQVVYEKAPDLTLVLFVNKEGKIEERIKDVKPTDEYLVAHRNNIFKDNFSGNIFLWSWSGDLLGGSFYQKGKKISDITPTKAVSNAKRKYEVCDLFTICYWSRVCLWEDGSIDLRATETVNIGSSACLSPHIFDPTNSFNCWNWVQTQSTSYQQCYDNGLPNPGEGSGPINTISPSSFVDLSDAVDMSTVDWTDLDEEPCRFNYNGENGLTESELFMEILKKKTMDHLGITDAAAAISVLSGANIISTRQKFGLSTNGTSLASKYISNLIPWQSPMRLPTLTGFPGVGQGVRLAMTKNVGRFIGRTIPLLGWGIAAYDLYSILDDTTSEFNSIVNSGGC